MRVLVDVEKLLYSLLSRVTLGCSWRRAAVESLCLAYFTFVSVLCALVSDTDGSDAVRPNQLLEMEPQRDRESHRDRPTGETGVLEPQSPLKDGCDGDEDDYDVEYAVLMFSDLAAKPRIDFSALSTSDPGSSSVGQIPMSLDAGTALLQLGNTTWEGQWRQPTYGSGVVLELCPSRDERTTDPQLQTRTAIVPVEEVIVTRLCEMKRVFVADTKPK